MFEIRKYNDADKEVWNAYVEHARNATFLLNRSYMDYHSDRFHVERCAAARKSRRSTYKWQQQLCTRCLIFRENWLNRRVQGGSATSIPKGGSAL